MFWAIYGVVFFAGFAMMVREGLWSNTISFCNIIISGLVAFSFYSPVTGWLDEQLSGTFTYVLDFVVVWGLFVVTMMLCRAVTRAASKTRMRFKHPIDPVGGPIIALFAAWVLSAFTTATLFMAPMPRDAFGNRFAALEEIRNQARGSSTAALTLPFMAPDITWLVFVQNSARPMAYGPGGNARPFLAETYLVTYYRHREKLESADAKWLRVRRN